MAGAQADSFVEVLNPATGERFARVPQSNARDVDAAAHAAKDAAKTWGQTSAQV